MVMSELATSLSNWPWRASSKTSASRIRIRSQSMVTRGSIESGSDRHRVRNVSRSKTRTSTSSRALTLADRGRSVISDISPKMSPGPRIDRRCSGGPAWYTSTNPRSMM
jgi:hypothetical protein